MTYRIEYERVGGWDCADIYEGERHITRVSEGAAYSTIELLEKEIAIELAQRNSLIESLNSRITYLEAQISAARKALENAQFTEALNVLDELVNGGDK